MEQLKNIIKNCAFELGFCEIGFARYEKLEKEIQNYIQWLKNGYSATMTYLEKNIDKREDVKLILDDVKTIIVTAYPYYNKFKHSSSLFKISRYAWGEDYHKILADKLTKLVDFISDKIIDFKCKIYVDTGPILEKSWAVRAGIGWQGKNSMIISRTYGSFIFLGIILTNIEFEPDKPIKDYCGTCTKCIESCPTNAIVQPKVVDSRKCISFWTIEAKPEYEIPSSINLNGWIFGCDICQEVCPWNNKVKITDDVAFYPRYNQTNLDKHFLENLTPEIFKERFKDSPIKRAKFEGLKRNFLHIIKNIEYEQINQ
jgi:epoxyqueuosine reductase